MRIKELRSKYEQSSIDYGSLATEELDGEFRFRRYLAFRLQRLGLLAELRPGGISNRVLLIFSYMKASSDEGAEEDQGHENFRTRRRVLKASIG